MREVLWLSQLATIWASSSTSKNLAQGAAKTGALAVAKGSLRVVSTSESFMSASRTSLRVKSDRAGLREPIVPPDDPGVTMT